MNNLNVLSKTNEIALTAHKVLSADTPKAKVHINFENGLLNKLNENYDTETSSRLQQTTWIYSFIFFDEHGRHGRISKKWIYKCLVRLVAASNSNVLGI